MYVNTGVRFGTHAWLVFHRLYIQYGGLIGSKELWLVDPLNDDVAAYYSKFGFELSYSKAHAAKYLHRQSVETNSAACRQAEKAMGRCRIKKKKQ